MIQLVAIAMIVMASISAVFLGLLPLMGGNKGKITVEGHLPGFLHLVWFAVKVWALVKLYGAYS